MTSLYTVDDSITGHRPHGKRHVEDDDVEHFFKKRLLDNFQNLQIFEGSKSQQKDRKTNSSSLDSSKPNKSATPNSSVHIDSMDQFLRDNQDSSDLEFSKRIDNINETTTMKEIVIPGGFLKPLNELFNDEHQNKNQAFLDSKQKDIVNRIMSRKKAKLAKDMENFDQEQAELDAMLDEGDQLRQPDIHVSNDEVYYETYLDRYWSLVRYYNPKLLIFKKAQAWYYGQRYMHYTANNRTRMKKNVSPVFVSDQIQELDEDGEDCTMIDDDEYIDEDETADNTAFNATSTPSPPRTQDAQISSGGYYNEQIFLNEDTMYARNQSTSPATISTENNYGGFYDAFPSYKDETQNNSNYANYDNNNNDDDDDEMEF